MKHRPPGKKLKRRHPLKRKKRRGPKDRLKSRPLQKLVAEIRKTGRIRAIELRARGVHQQYLKWAVEEGLIERLARGLYVVPGTKIRSSDHLAEACRRVANGVICLRSALHFHGLIAEPPTEIWMAIGGRSRRTDVGDLQIRVIRLPRAMATKDVIVRRTPEGSVRVFSPAKAVADCFRHRYLVGLDTGVRALQECWRQHKASRQALVRAAGICKVQDLMLPYVRTLA